MTALLLTRDGKPIGARAIAGILGWLMATHGYKGELVELGERQDMKAFLDWLRGVSFKYCGSMLMEPNGEAGKYVTSLGRAMALALLSLALWQWYHDKDITASHQHTLDVILGYVFGSKALQLAKDYAATRLEPQAATQQPAPVQAVMPPSVPS